METGIMAICSTTRIQKSICQSRYKNTLRNIGIEQNIPMYAAMATRIMCDIWLALLRSFIKTPPRRFIWLILPRKQPKRFFAAIIKGQETPNSFALCRPSRSVFR
jgi:hypothetical protein